MADNEVIWQAGVTRRAGINWNLPVDWSTCAVSFRIRPGSDCVLITEIDLFMKTNMYPPPFYRSSAATKLGFLCVPIWRLKSIIIT